MPEGVSKWEIGGVSALPIVQAALAMDLPSLMSMTTEQFFSVLAGLVTLAAIVRAMADNRKAKSGE